MPVKKRRNTQKRCLVKKTIALLKHAYSHDASVREAAEYAGMSLPALYNMFQTEPGLKEQLETLRSKPTFFARSTIVKNLDKPKNAQWYLEKKVPEEFGNVVTNKYEGEVKITHQIADMSDQELLKIISEDNVIEGEIIEDGQITGSEDGVGSEGDGSTKT